jgi:AcrR family transcriptional regulator
MYHHFPSKRDLALAALERNCADLLPASEALLTGDGDSSEKLAQYLSQPKDALKGCKVGRMTQDPLVATDPELLAPVADAFDRIHQALVRVLRTAIEVGELSAELDPDRLAYLLTATIQGGYVLAIAQQDRRPFDEARAGALDLLRAAAPRATPRSEAAEPSASPKEEEWTT